MPFILELFFFFFLPYLVHFSPQRGSTALGEGVKRVFLWCCRRDVNLMFYIVKQLCMEIVIVWLIMLTPPVMHVFFCVWCFCFVRLQWEIMLQKCPSFETKFYLFIYFKHATKMHLYPSCANVGTCLRRWTWKCHWPYKCACLYAETYMAK